MKRTAVVLKAVTDRAECLKGPTMSKEIHHRMDRFVEFINSGDAAIGREVIGDFAVFHVPFAAEPMRGVEGYLGILSMMRSAFSDVRWAIDETIAEGDKIAARFTLTGTHDGTFFGVPATGKSVRVTAINIYHFNDGLIVEEFGMPNVVSILAQIGALPESPSV